MQVVALIAVVVAVEALAVVLFRALALANERMDGSGELVGAPSLATGDSRLGDR